MKYNKGQNIYIIDWVYRNEYRIKGIIKKVKIRGVAEHISSRFPWYFINKVDKETGYYETVYEPWVYKTKEEALMEIKKELKKDWELLENNYKYINKEYCKNYMAIQKEIEKNLTNKEK